MTILILCWSLLWIFIYSQKGKYRLKGGGISLPKKFWLSFATFIYYPLPLFLMAIHGYEPMLIVVFTFFLIRAVVQVLAMYLFKNWSPKAGIAFNMLAPLVVLTVAIISFPLPKDILAYAILVVVCAITDAYYAWQFWKIIGDRSKGNKPIWFASDSKEYSKLNKLTTLMNVLLFGIFFYAYYWEIFTS